MIRSFIYNKKSDKTLFTGTSWQGLGGGLEDQIRNSYNNGYATGKFGIVGQNMIFTRTANINSVALIQGVDFQHDKRLDASTTEDPIDGFGTISGGIIDTNISGDIAENKAFRIIDSSTGATVNIKTMGLKVYSKDLTTFVTPPADRIYLDPLNGRFSMPKVAFWSKCTSLATITTPEVGVCTIPGSSPLTYAACKFDSGVYMPGTSVSAPSLNAINYRYTSVRPSNCNLTKGSVSFWCKISSSITLNYVYLDEYNAFPIPMTSETAAGGSVFFGGVRSEGYGNCSTDDGLVACTISSGSNTGWGVGIAQWVLNAEPLTQYRRLVLLFGSTVVGYVNVSKATLYHIYIAWDQAKSLSGGKSIRVFLNGSEVISTTNNLPSLTDLNFSAVAGRGASGFAMQSTSAYYGYTWLDNVKIWTDIIEDPSFEYNSGTGRESALHNIYGSSNNCQPSMSFKYKYIPPSDTPANLPKPTGGNTIIQLENISDYSNCIGYFGSSHKISKSDFTNLYEGVDYNYSDTLTNIYDTNASGVFSSGKIIRVVENGKNVNDITGLNLTPIAKNMTLSDNFSPSSNQIYIDPYNGKIALPGPIYWNKTNTQTPYLCRGLYSISYYQSNFTPTGGKFGDGNLSSLSSGSTISKSNISINLTSFPRKGTISVWNALPACGNTNGFGILALIGKLSSDSALQDASPFGVNHFTFGNGYNYIQIIFEGVVKATYSYGSPAYLSEIYDHIYVLWDYDKTLVGTDSIASASLVVFKNGVKILSITDTLPESSDNNIYITQKGRGDNGTRGDSYYSNLKIWNHIVTEDPTMEYNSGSGRENTLHYIYGATHDYAPYNLQVGYYKSSSIGNLITGNV